MDTDPRLPSPPEVAELTRDHPDPRTLQLRLERLARAGEHAADWFAREDDTARASLLALVTLGDAPVDLAAGDPGRLPLLASPPHLADPFLDTPDPETDLAGFKRHTWLRILLRERTRRADVDATMTDLARLADRVATAALAKRGREDLLLYALGKWGGQELNASSDIDPVFFGPVRTAEEGGDAAVRQWANELTDAPGGPIYDVDLRLRPEGASGPLVCSWAEAERYFFQRAAPWERIAWLRARPVAGDAPPWFGDLLASFLFPPGRDPREAVRDTARALASVHRSAGARDLKRGAGGIRDVEFVTASVQLREGRQVEPVRHGPVLELLHTMGRMRLLDREDAERLADAYRFLRRAEHALQAEEDRPRFTLPAPGTPGHARLAWALGLTPPQFEERWGEHREAVSAAVERAFAEVRTDTAPASLDPQPEHDIAPVSGKSSATTRAVLRRLTGPWGPADALFDPEFLDGRPGEEDALVRLESAVLAYGGPEAWVRAFAGHPTLRRDITRILVHGRRIVEEGVARPYLWERIGLASWPHHPSPEANAATLSAGLGDLLFHLGEQFLAGDSGPEEVTTRWSEGVQGTLEAFGLRPPPTSPPLAVLALGKWGGEELAPDADLDVMLVCGNGDADSVAAAVEYGARWLGEATLGGRLQLDPRLRPEGSGAPLVITLDRLEEYLVTRAQPWEKLGLARARPVLGDPETGARALAILQDYCAAPPGPEGWRAVDLARRKTAAEASRGGTKRLKIKKARGGMMDFEFASTFAAWREGIGPGDWWRKPVHTRLRELGGVTGRKEYRDAATAYLELRRWELIQLFGSGHRRGDVPTSGDEAARFADAAGFADGDIARHWQAAAAQGRALYDALLPG